MNNDIKWVAISNAIIKSIGCICVLAATYITKNANCLWGLFLVIYMGMNLKNGKDIDTQG